MQRETLRRAQALYASAPPWVQLHIAGRIRLCPFLRIAAHVPRSGRIVDMGCGHGVFVRALAFESPQRILIGVEPDERKLAVTRSIAHAHGRVHWVRASAISNPMASFDALLMIDVLYLIPYSAQRRILYEAFARLSLNGVVVIKTMDDRPRWKATLNRLQEWLAVRVWRITLGAKFYFRSLVGWQALLESIGYTVVVERLDRGYYHPHGLVVGYKACASG